MALPISIGLTAVGLGVLSKYVPPDDVAPGKTFATIFTGMQNDIIAQTQETQQKLTDMKSKELDKIETKLTQQIKNVQQNANRLLSNSSDKKEQKIIAKNASLEIQKLKENALRNATRTAALIGNTEQLILNHSSKTVDNISIKDNTSISKTNPNKTVIVNDKYRNFNIPNYDIITFKDNTTNNNNYQQVSDNKVTNIDKNIQDNQSTTKNIERIEIENSKFSSPSKNTSIVNKNVVMSEDSKFSKNTSIVNKNVVMSEDSKFSKNTSTVNKNVVMSEDSKFSKNTSNVNKNVVMNENSKFSSPSKNTSIVNKNVVMNENSKFSSPSKNTSIVNKNVVMNENSKFSSPSKNTSIVNKNVVMNENTKFSKNTSIVNKNVVVNENSKFSNDDSNVQSLNQSNVKQLIQKAKDALEMNSSNNISDDIMVQNAYKRAKEIIEQAEKDIQKKLEEADKNINTLKTEANIQASLIIKKAEENAASLLKKQMDSQKMNSQKNAVANVSKQIKEQAELEARRIIETAQANARRIRKDAQNSAQNNAKLSEEKMNTARKIVEDAQAKAAKIMNNVNKAQSDIRSQVADLSRKEQDLQQKLLEIQRLEEKKIKETIKKAVDSVSQGNSNTTKNALTTATKTVNQVMNETEEMRKNIRNQSKLLAEKTQNVLQKQTNEQLQLIANATLEQTSASAEAKSILDKANLEAQRIIAEAKIQAGKANKANANTAYDIIANANKKATDIQAKAQEAANRIIRNAQNVVKGMNDSSANCSSYSLNSKLNPDITPPSFNNQLDNEYIDKLHTRVNEVISQLQSNPEQFVKNKNLSSMFSEHNNVFIPLPEFDTDLFNDRTILDHIYSSIVKLYEIVTGVQVNKITNTSVVETIQEIIRLYIGIIRKLLSTPVMYKLTGLDADSMKSLIASTSIQLYNENFKPVNKSLFMEKLYKFLYIDLTPYLFVRQHPSLNPYYSNYTKQLEDYIIQDTKNSSFVLYPKSGPMDKRSIFILRFIDMISNTYSKNDRNTKSFNYHVLTYIITILPDIYNFVHNLYYHIENPENDAFAMSINMLLFRKLRQNVLTYIKIRNDDGTVYNDRFKVFVDSSKNDTLLVRYNDHNIPYYSFDNTHKSWTVSPTIKEDWNSLYNTPTFDEVFDVKNSMLSVKGYSDEYLLGPFTRVFEQQLNNRNIAERMDEVVVALNKDNKNPQPVFLIGYGASGAGKTSSLVYFNKGIDIDSQNGILMHLCNRLSEGDGYKNIRVKSIEFYAKEGSGQPIKRKSPVDKDHLKFHYTPSKGFVLSDTYNHKNAFKARVMQQLKGNNIDDFRETQFPQETVLGEVMIHMIDNDRFVKATTNNPNSSRSHCLIFINFGDEISDNSNSDVEFDPKRTLIVGDFAGVENLFNCTDDKQLKGFLNVKKDDGSGKPFYSEEDKSLSGQEGGEKNKKYIGGRVEDTENPCVIAIKDTSNIFKLGLSPRTLRTKDESLEVILKNLFDETKFYNGFLKSIYTNVVTSAQIETNDPFNTLLNTPVDKVEKYFIEYENNNIKTLVNNGYIFVNVFNKFASLKENSDDSQNAFEKFLSDVNIEVDTSYITYNFKDEKEIPSGKDNTTAYQMLIDSTSGLKITPAPFLKAARECVITPGETTFLSYSSAKKIFDNSFCVRTYSANQKDDYASRLLSSMDNAENIVRNMKQGIHCNYTNNEGEILYLSSYSIDKKVPMKCAKISNKRLITEVISVLNHPLFSMIGIDIYDNIVKLREIGKQFSDQYIRYKLEPFIAAVNNKQIDLQEFFKHLLNEAKSIVVNTSCRIKHSTKVCSVRRAEGVFINNSLYGIREVIKEIMYEKNKNSMNIAPLFHEPCLPTYCGRDNRDCFKLVKPKISIANQIFEALIEELNPSLRGIAPEKIPKGETLKDLIVGVFCVLNLSRKANNPPPVPYINTNHIRFELSKSEHINTNILKECKKLFDKLQFFLHKNSKVRIELNPGWIYNLKTIIENEKYSIEKGINSEQENALYNLLNALDNVSAASAMGTLQFVDMMSKYNTTDTICSQQKLMENTNLYNQLIQKLDLVDIVNKKDKYNVSKFQLGDHKIFIEPEKSNTKQSNTIVNINENTKVNKVLNVKKDTQRNYVPLPLSNKTKTSSMPFGTSKSAKPTRKGRR